MYPVAKDYPPPDNYWQGPSKYSVDWLWYKFENTEMTWTQKSINFIYNIRCHNCDCFGVKTMEEYPVRCWNCGRFLKYKPKEVELRLKSERLWG